MSSRGQRAKDWPFLAALLLIAAGLFFNVVASRQCPSVYGLGKRGDEQRESTGHKGPAPAVSVSPDPANELKYATDEEGCSAGLFGISADGWVALFTLALSISTIGLWIATERAAQRSDAASLRQVTETRRIGEAQVRAYLSCVGGLYMEGKDAVRCRVRIKNAGQSPALSVTIEGYAHLYTSKYGELIDIRSDETSFGDSPIAAGTENEIFIGWGSAQFRTPLAFKVFASQTGLITLVCRVEWRDVFDDWFTAPFSLKAALKEGEIQRDEDGWIKLYAFGFDPSQVEPAANPTTPD